MTDTKRPQDKLTGILKSVLLAQTYIEDGAVLSALRILDKILKDEGWENGNPDDRDDAEDDAEGRARAACAAVMAREDMEARQ